jgi:hypothetical protein
MMHQSTENQQSLRSSPIFDWHDGPSGCAIMDSATRPGGLGGSYDPYFQTTDVGPAKGPTSPAPGGGRGRRIYRRRVAMLGAVLAVVWLGVLLDPRIGPIVLMVAAGFGAVLGLFGAAMGLGLLGFGLCTAGDRFIAWLRRGARWPEE